VDEKTRRPKLVYTGGVFVCGSAKKERMEKSVQKPKPLRKTMPFREREKARKFRDATGKEKTAKAQILAEFKEVGAGS